MSVVMDPDGPSSGPGIPAEIFRAYDIRGIYGAQLDERGIERIGRSIGSEALDQGIDTLLAGRDGRLSSPALFNSLIAGILGSGCHVVDLGIVPTPLVYFATHRTEWTSGVMLTASHNPAAYNGVKIVFRQSCLAENQIQNLRRRIETGELRDGQGSHQALDIKRDYVDYVRQNIALDRPLRLVIDCGNGVTGVVAPLLFETLGCEVTPLYCELDGRFPNHDPDPTQAENLAALQERVQALGADLGLAFDGDGDRLGVVTGEGDIVDTDLLLATLIESIVPAHPGKPVIYDVKCSARLAPLIESLGGVPIMHRSGHSLMKQKMQETGAPVGGEFSAHIFIKDRWFGYDDGLYTGARLVEILSRGNEPLAAGFASLGERCSTPEIKVPVAESRKFELMAQIRQQASFDAGRRTEIDGLRVDFDDGWGLVRPSNTSPALLLRFEADTPAVLDRIKGEFRRLLLRVDAALPIDF